MNETRRRESDDDLGEWVRHARKVLGWSQERLGQEFRVSKQAISFWESGTTKPSYEQVRRISDLTHIVPPGLVVTYRTCWDCETVDSCSKSGCKPKTEGPAPQVLQPLAPSPAERIESVLIDGVAYTIPAAVAGELLRLQMEVQVDRAEALRDGFAGQAMQAMCDFWGVEPQETLVEQADEQGRDPIDYLATKAYEIADAMLVARAAEPQTHAASSKADVRELSVERQRRRERIALAKEGSAA